MSDTHWFWLAIGAEGIVIALVMWLGLRKQATRFGCYVARAEAVVERGENAAIQFRACVAWLHDLENEKRRDHPVVPPDSLPDDMDGAA